VYKRQELRFRTVGFPWRVFDTYKTKEDPELKKYHDMLSNTKFNGGVKVIEIGTTRKEVAI
jgi:hypothetical protein